MSKNTLNTQMQKIPQDVKWRLAARQQVVVDFLFFFLFQSHDHFLTRLHLFFDHIK